MIELVVPSVLEVVIEVVLRLIRLIRTCVSFLFYYYPAP